MESFKELMQRRVFGIPVMYVAGIFVAILAFVAWRMAPSKDKDAGSGDNTDGPPGSGDGLGEGGTVTTGDFDGTIYDGLKTSGTVVVAPTPPEKELDKVYTNEEWVRDGAAWLVAQNKASSTEAASALSKYINGQDRSYAEDALVNAWSKEKGLPPSMPDSSGNVIAPTPALAKPSPAQKQGSPPIIHKVKGSSDNTLAELANLYYGRADAQTIDLIQGSNPNIKNDAGPFPIGFGIRIPVWHVPKYYVTPRIMTTKEIAAKNGLASWSIEVLNNTTKTSWAKNSRVRVA